YVIYSHFTLFSFNVPTPTEISTLSLHDALPIYGAVLATGGHPVPAFDASLPHKATHAVFGLDDGSRLYLTDIRQFGRIWLMPQADRKSTRLNSSHVAISYAVFCLKKKKERDIAR